MNVGVGVCTCIFLVDRVPSFYEFLKKAPDPKRKKKIRITVLKETLGLVSNAPQTIAEKIRKSDYRVGSGGTENGISGPFSPEPDSHQSISKF